MKVPEPGDSARDVEPAEGPVTGRVEYRLLTVGEPTGGLTGQAEVPVLPRGAQVDRYTILEELGAGGMGVVYSAYDSGLQRKVAIKLLHSAKAGGSSSASGGQARLLREAQALAQVAHPNIVAVHDVGAYGDSVFMAMEFLEGQNLRAWLRAEPRHWREVLRVFLEAGRGLAAAHAKGLLHRDFKPDNVLLTREGRVVVVDFGLARQALLPTERVADNAEASVSSAPPMSPPIRELSQASESPASDSLSAPVTQAGMVIGTLSYMAPELLKGASGDLTTDAYAFGISLYEGLYGRRPIQDGLKLAFPSPGPGVHVPTWVRRAILRSLSPNPAERYPSLQAFLDELGRDPSVRRRRQLLALGGVALVATVALGVRQVVTGRNQLCQGADRSLQGVWDPPTHESVHRAFLGVKKPFAEDTWQRTRSLLDAYASRWVSMRTEACQATRIAGTQSEEVLSLRMVCLDRRLNDLRALKDVLEGADDVVVQNAVKAANSLAPLLGCADVEALRAPTRLPSNPAVREQVADMRVRLARVKALLNSGKYKEGLPEAKLVAEAAKSLHYRPLEAEALASVGYLYERLEQRKEAQVVLHQAIAAAEAANYKEVLFDATLRLMGILPEVGQRELYWQWNDFAHGVLEAIGKSTELEDALLFNTAYALRLEHRDADATRDFQELVRRGQEGHVDPMVLTGAYNDLAVIAQEAGRPADALPYLQQALHIYDKVLGPNHPARLFPLINLGVSLQALQGCSDEAGEALKSVLAASEEVRGAESLTTLAGQANVATFEGCRGDFDKALSRANAALVALVRTQGANSSYRPAFILTVAQLQLARNDHRSALTTFSEAVQVSEALSPGGVETAAGLEGKARALEGLGRRAEALEQHHAARKLFAKAGMEGTAGGLDGIFGLGQWYLQGRQFSQAVPLFEQVLEIQQKTLATTHPDLVMTQVRLAEAHLGLGDAGRARDELRAAVQHLEEGHGAPELLAGARFSLARATWEDGHNWARVEPLLAGARGDYARSQALPSRARQELTSWTARHALGSRAVSAR